jgi:hypothetical protein
MVTASISSSLPGPVIGPVFAMLFELSRATFYPGIEQAMSIVMTTFKMSIKKIFLLEFFLP